MEKIAIVNASSDNKRTTVIRKTVGYEISTKDLEKYVIRKHRTIVPKKK